MLPLTLVETHQQGSNLNGSSAQRQARIPLVPGHGAIGGFFGSFPAFGHGLTKMSARSSQAGESGVDFWADLRACSQTCRNDVEKRDGRRFLRRFRLQDCRFRAWESAVSPASSSAGEHDRGGKLVRPGVGHFAMWP